jgi:hypothetical protein
MRPIDRTIEALTALKESADGRADRARVSMERQGSGRVRAMEAAARADTLALALKVARTAAKEAE